MKQAQRKPTKSAPIDDPIVPTLDAAVEQVLGRVDALIETDHAPSEERAAISRALEDLAGHLAKLDEAHNARIVEVRRLRELLREQVLGALRTAADVVKTRSAEASAAASAAEAAQAELEAARDQAGEIQRRLDQLAAARDLLASERDTHAQQARAAEAATRAARGDIARLEDQLRDALGTATEAGLSLADARHEADGARAEAERLRLAHAEQDARSRADRAAWVEERQRLAADLQALTARSDRLEAEAQVAAAELDRLRAELASARQESVSQAASIAEQHDGFIVSLTEEYEEKLAAAERRTSDLEQSLRAAEQQRDQDRDRLAHAERGRDATQELAAQRERDAQQAQDKLAGVTADRDEALGQLEAERERVLELERELVDSQRRPLPQPIESQASFDKLRADLADTRQELQHVLSERDAAITDALRIQRELDDARAALDAGALSEPELVPSSLIPAPIDPGSSAEDLKRSIDRLERERDEAMHTLAELRMDLTRNQDENRKLKGMIGLVDDVQLVLPVDDLDPIPGEPSASPRASGGRARRSKPPERSESGSSYFMSGESIREEALRPRSSRRSGTSEPAPGTPRRRSRSK